MTGGDGFIPLPGWAEVPEDEMRARAKAFFEAIRTRRSVRDFSDRPVPREIIENAIRATGAAPSGANQQPWHFAAVSDPDLKHRIRLEAEEEERAFYNGRAGEEWLDALKHLGTNAEKPFLDTAPWLITIFAERYGLDENGDKYKNYYVTESVGLAAGFLIAALHHAGLVTLTHTPSRMAFLNAACGRPKNEYPMILLVVGYPAEGCEVPDISRRDLDEISSFF